MLHDSVSIISLSLRLRLITLTSTLIIPDITKISSNNCLIYINQIFKTVPVPPFVLLLSSISFSSSKESELHKDPASFINHFDVVVVVQWKAACCRIHLRPVMVRYGLAKVLRGVKALQTRKKSANGFENLR